ncbi:DUF4365 domain-containing protein [Kitasatospora sp. NPDC051853]|uniref:DUF4365 domain-containing protein n=1 Tax=Kitasatospora sp. NPDC051853 TaxID=3364058 RepID=UPI0037AA835C
MKVEATHQIDRTGASSIALLATRELNWLCREQPISDIGVDAHLEVVTEDGYATGRLLAVQIKSGSSFFSRPADGGWWFACDDEHVTYWLNHSLPVVVMLYEPASQTAYWQHVAEDHLVRTGKNFKMLIPATQVLNADARDALSSPARQDSAPEPLQKAVDCLPATVRSILLRADLDDPQARSEILRLARDLSEASDAAEVVAGLLNRTPRWLEQLPSERAAWAWHAVASYTVAHQLRALLVPALVKAAESATTHRARLKAIAALAASHHDRDRAPALIAAARSEQPLITAIAQHLLDFPDRDHGRMPEAVTEAVRCKDPAAESAQVWSFIAETHLAGHRDADAVEAFRQALEFAPQDPAIQESLAAALVRHTASGGPALSHVDLRQAVSLATAARAEFRRWKGPSGSAATSLLRARVMADDVAQALRTALAAPAGEAEGLEIDYQPLLLEGARMAHHAGLTAEAAKLTARITDTGAIAQLRAVALQSLPDADRQAVADAWEQALEAACDDEQTFIAASAITSSGTWPVPALEALHHAGALSTPVYEIQHARAEAAQGDTAAAVRRLRQLESTSVAAAAELILLLRITEDFPAAAQTADTAGIRYQDLTLRQLAVQLWHKAKQPDLARLKAVTLLSRPDLPRGSRHNLRRQLVEWAYEREDWTDMEDHALAGVVEGQSAPISASSAADATPLSDDATAFAWAAIRAQIGSRRLDAAWRTYASFGPVPHRVTEVHLWLITIQWHGWSPVLAELALTLAERFREDTDLTSKLLGSLLHGTGSPESDEAPDASPSVGSPSPLVLTPSQRTRLQTLLGQLPLTTPGLRQIPADIESLHQFVLDTYGPRKALIDATADATRMGIAPMGLLAMAAGRPVALAYAQCAAGLTPIANFASPHHQAEIRTASTALNGIVTLDISAIAVATLIPERFDELRAVFSGTPTTTAARDDLINTRYAIDSLLHSSGHVGLHNDQLTFTTLAAADRAHLSERLQTLSPVIQSLSTHDSGDLNPMRALLRLPTGQPAANDAPWLGAASLARETGSPLWCDDAALRRLLHQAGISTFSTLALLHVLTNDNAYPGFTTERHRRDINTLLRAGAADLPFRIDDLLALAKDDRWQPKAASLFLLSPSHWRRPDCEQIWSHLVTAIWENAPEQLPGWYERSVYGFTAFAHPEAVLDSLSALTASTITAIGVGPEPVQAIREAVAGSLDTCFKEAIRRHSPLGTDLLDVQTPPSEDRLWSRVRSLIVQNLTESQGFASQTANVIADQACL